MSDENIAPPPVKPKRKRRSREERLATWKPGAPNSFEPPNLIDLSYALEGAAKAADVMARDPNRDDVTQDEISGAVTAISILARMMRETLCNKGIT